VNRAPDWLRMATRDLGLAEVASASGYHEGAAFHAQQCAEKAVIAVHESLGTKSRGHSITLLFQGLPACALVPDSLLQGAAALSAVYLSSRYPDEFDSGTPRDYFNEDSSRELIAYGRAMLEWCRTQIH